MLSINLTVHMYSVKLNLTENWKRKEKTLSLSGPKISISDNEKFSINKNTSMLLIHLWHETAWNIWIILKRIQNFGQWVFWRVDP